MQTNEIIASILNEKKISKRKLAETIGLPPSTLISALSSGDKKLSFDTVLKIAAALDVTIDQLLPDDSVFVGDIGKEIVIPLENTNPQKEIDNTIIALCKWVQEYCNSLDICETDIAPKMINALSALITANKTTYPEPKDIELTIDGEEIAKAMSKSYEQKAWEIKARGGEINESQGNKKILRPGKEEVPRS